MEQVFVTVPLLNYIVQDKTDRVQYEKIKKRIKYAKA